MRKMLMAAFGVGCALAAAAGAQAGVEGLYGNTLVVTFPGGDVVRVHLKPDGAFDMKMPDGSPMTGTYAVETDKVCFTPTPTPAPAPAPAAGAAAPAPAPPEKRCTPPMDGKKVGDRWDMPGPNDQPIKFTIEAGS